MGRLGWRISLGGEREVSSSAFRRPSALWVLVVVAFMLATPLAAFASGEERTTVGDDLVIRTDTRWAGGAVGGYLPVRVEIANQAGARSLVLEITPSDRAHGATVKRVVGVDEHAIVHFTLPIPLTAFRQGLLRVYDQRGELSSHVRIIGSAAPFGFSSEVDQLAPAYVQHFRTLVLRRAGSASRPPSNYRLAYRGHFYDVWQKRGSNVVQHIPLGDPLQPGAMPSCSALQKFGRAGGGTRLAYVERPFLPVMPVVTAHHPKFWTPDGTDPSNLRPYGAGTLTGSLTVPGGGGYTVWVQGSFGRGYTVLIDGRRVGEVKNQLNGRGQFAMAGTVTVAPGRHAIQLVRPSGNLSPGDGGRNRLLGPVVLDPSSDARTVKEIPASNWRQLCGRRLDWIESIR